MARAFTAAIAWIERRAPVAAIGIIGLILAAGFTYSLHQGQTLRYPDEEDYAAMATHLAEGRGFTLDGSHPTAFRPPAYPLFLGALRSAGAGVPLARCCQFAALALSMGMIYVLLRPVSPLAGVLGVAGVAAYPVAFYTAGVLYPQTLATTLLLATLLLLFRRKPLQARHFLLAGALLGILILLVPTFLFGLLVIAGWVSLREPRTGWRQALLIGIAAGATLLPWTVRNYTVFRSVVPISTNGGWNLLLGNSENTTPNAGVNVDITRYVAETHGMNEVEADRHFTRAALRFMRQHPARAATLYAGKFLNYFNYRNRLYVQSESSRARDLAALLTYGPLLLVAFGRILFRRRIPLTPFDRFALAFYLLNAAYAAIFFTRIRFRLPFDFLLICVCAGFLAKAARPAGAGNARAGLGDAQKECQ